MKMDQAALTHKGKIKNTVLKALLSTVGQFQARSYDISKTLVISGSPRSGTTWIAQLFAQIPKACIIWEPLHLRWQPDLVELGFTWRTIIDPQATWPEGHKLLCDILSGRRLNLHTTHMCNLRQIITRRLWIVKFVRASGILNWLTRNFTIRPPIVAVRHPCAVVSSQMHRRRIHKTATENGTLSKWHQGLPNFAKDFLSKYPQFESVLMRAKTWEDILAVIWCMDTYQAVTPTGQSPWIILPYEKLVVDGKNTLRTLFSHLNLPWSDEFVQGLFRPSATVVPGSNVFKGLDPLTGWQARLSESQIERILSVVNDFDLRFYSEEPEPNYAFLNAKSRFSL